MKVVSIISLVALTITLIFTTGCATRPAIPEAAPMPAGKTFSGLWYSPQFEQMYLSQRGDTVRGIYTYREGGKITGHVNGNLLIFQWDEPGDKNKARRGFNGKGYLRLNVQPNRTYVEGEWGYNDNETGAGPWEAEYIRPLESDDPLTLDAYKNEQ